MLFDVKRFGEREANYSSGYNLGYNQRYGYGLWFLDYGLWTVDCGWLSIRYRPVIAFVISSDIAVGCLFRRISFTACVLLRFMHNLAYGP